MPEPASPRQLLYAMVGAGFHVVVGVLALASAGLAPGWWTAVVAVFWVAAAALIGLAWRRTALVLGLSMGGFIAWTIGAAFLLT